MEPSDRNVFGLLDQIRARPAMYLREESLQDLETLILGYYACHRVQGTVETVPQMNDHFQTWFCHRTGWSCSQGWAASIQRNSESERNLSVFFDFVDEYRKLLPTRLCTVRLGAKNKPTGKRVLYGHDGLMDKPRRVDIYRYRPESLHFLRFHYRDRVEDSSLLMTALGKHATTLSHAKQWVRDELQVELKAWEQVARSRA